MTAAEEAEFARRRARADELVRAAGLPRLHGPVMNQLWALRTYPERPAALVGCGPLTPDNPNPYWPAYVSSRATVEFDWGLALQVYSDAAARVAAPAFTDPEEGDQLCLL